MLRVVGLQISLLWDMAATIPDVLLGGRRSGPEQGCECSFAALGLSERR